jgi:hypothetical protein
MKFQKTHLRFVIPAMIVLLFGASLIAIGSASEAPHTAQTANNSSYYDDNRSLVNNETWMDNRSNATAENSTHMLTRIGSFVVGGGEEGGPVGALLTSLIMGSVVVGFVGVSRIGMVAGGTVGVLTLGGMASAGWAPGWLFALVIFGVGLVLTTVLIRANR